jgi:uncharacterized protein YjbJ (UPF0337 family)
MNWDQIQGQLQQVGGKLKEKWGKLTDDDLLLLKGKKEVFLGKLQARAGLVKDDAEKQLDAFLASFEPEKADPPPKAGAAS